MRVPFLLIALAISGFANSQKKASSFPTDSSSTIAENGWIEKLGNYLNIKLAITGNVESFLVDTDDDDYAITPNASTVSRLYVNYRFLSLALSYTPGFIRGNRDDDVRGKTKSAGLWFGLNFRQAFTELSYSRTRGYYLENTSDFITGWQPGNPYIQFPDLIVSSFEGMTGYNFNPRFSQNSITVQTERQLKSADTFIPVLAYRYYIVDNRAPTGVAQKSNNFQILLGAGYHYNLVMKSDVLGINVKQRVYFSAGATPAVGYIFTRLLTRDPVEYAITRSNNGIVQLSGRLGAGYNGRRVFGGFYLSFTTSDYRQGRTTVITSDTKSYSQFFLGYRFNAPKSLQEGYNRTIGKYME